jgi:ATP-binding cassette subfamily C exporter for protease/lipase
MNKYKLLKYILKKYKAKIILAIILSLVANILMLTPTIYMLQIYDRVMLSQSEITLIAVSIIAMGMLLSMAISEWLRANLLLFISKDIDKLISSNLFNTVFSKRLNNNTQQAVQPFSDLALVKQLVSGPSMYAILDAPWTPIYVGVMFLMHPLLGWVSLFFLLNMLFIGWITAKKTSQYKDESLEEEKESNSFVYSKFRNAEVIEAHGMTLHLRNKWWAKQKEVINSITESESFEMLMTTISKEVSILKQSLALGLGAYLVIHGDLSVGSMIAANLLMSRTTAPVDAMISGWKNFQEGILALNRIEEIFNKEEKQIEGIINNNKFTGKIEVKNLYIKFPNIDQHTIKNICLSIPAGQRIALIGDSGSGKSTLVKSILGLIPIEQGEIKWDDISLEKINRSEIGHMIGYLSQDVALFDGTIAENIARMNKIEYIKVIHSAQKVGMHEIILRLPEGYNTRINGRGGALSSGQKQRLALARALYNSPKLLVLDEPDSNLDEVGEKSLETTLKELVDTKTTILLITHRKKLLEQVDRILKIDNGQIISDEIVK